MLDSYLPILILIILAIVIAGGMMVGNAILGPRRLSKTKLLPFECGSVPSDDPKITGRKKFSIKFYLIAIVFLLFDIETVFLYPWAVVFKELSSQGFAALMFFEMFAFVTILVLGLWYLWKKGGLEWD